MPWLRSSDSGQARSRTQVSDTKPGSFHFASALRVYSFESFGQKECIYSVNGKTSFGIGLGVCVCVCACVCTHTYIYTIVPQGIKASFTPDPGMLWSRKQVQKQRTCNHSKFGGPCLRCALTWGCCKGHSLACIRDLKL